MSEALGDTPHAYYTLKATREYTLCRLHLTWIQFLQARNMIFTDILLDATSTQLSKEQTLHRHSLAILWRKPEVGYFVGL